MKRTFFFLLVFLSLFSLSTVFAEKAKVETPGGWLNMRAKPSTQAVPLKQVPNRTTVTYLEQTDDTWSKITYQGISGYVQTKYIVLLQIPQGKVLYPNPIDSLFIRSAGSDDSQILAEISSQVPLTVLQSDDDWTLVSFKTQDNETKEGYIRTEHIIDQHTTAQKYPSYLNEEGIVVSGQVLYHEPSKSATSTVALPKGFQVKVLYMDGDWCKVQADNITYGFLPVSALNLTGEKAKEENNLQSYTATYYLCTVPSGNLPVYVEPTGKLEENLRKTITVDPNQKLPVIHQSYQSHGVTWAEVICDGHVYWTPASSLSVTDETNTMHYDRPVENFTGGVVYAKEGAKLYASGSRFSKVLATIPAGTELLAGLRNTCISVTYNGQDGYMLYEDVVCGLAQYMDQDEEWYYWEHLNDPAPSPSPTPLPVYDESRHISQSKARSLADTALKSAYQAKITSDMQVNHDKVKSSRGKEGPFYEFAYFKDGKYLYNVLIHAETGEVAFTADYTNFHQTSSHATEKPRPAPNNAGEISASKARNTADSLLRSTYGGFDDHTYNVVNERFDKMPDYNEPVFRLNYYAGENFAYTCVVGAKSGKVLYHTDIWSGANTELDYSTPTPPPVYESTIDIGKDRAISIAKNALAGKYPDFNANGIIRTDCTLHTEHGHLPLPYYYINFFVSDTEFYSCAVNAYTGEVQETSGNLPGEGNG